MRIVTEPKVYLIHRPQIVHEGWNAFLADQGLQWPTPPTKPCPNCYDSNFEDGVQPDCEECHGDLRVPIPDAQRIIEIAGRCCYVSFGNKAGSKTNAAYLRNLIGFDRDGPAHGCYDDETDVLTSEGWIPWPDVKETHKLATRAPDGSIEYHPPRKLIHYNHRGKMYRVEAPGVDLLVTPDHRILVCPTTIKEGRKKQNFQLIQAQEIGHRSHAYIKSGMWTGGNNSIHPNVAAILGFTIGDGSIAYRKIRFHLRRERKISWLKHICSETDWEFTQHPNDSYSVLIPDEFRLLFESIYDENREKQIPQHILMHWSKDTLDGLFAGLMQSDGHIGRTSLSYDTTSQTLTGQIQQLALHIGMAANYGYTHQPEEREARGSFPNGKPLTRMHFIRRMLKPEVNKYVGCKGRTYWIEDWEGDVYCAEVPNHTLYVRRNGKPVWSGNSVTEHCNYGFIVVGGGRGFSHELVRHRVGVAYSQLSTRYCDFEREEEEGTWDPGFCIPALGQLTDRSTELIQGAMEEAVESYKAILKSIMADLANDGEFQASLDRANITGRERRTMIRKAARGAARDVLPIGTEAIMTFSANARSLWNMIYLRASPHAEAQIRSAFVQITKIMMDELPDIFGGTEIYTIWDGSECVRLPREKL